MTEDRDVPPSEVYLRTRADVGTQTNDNIFREAESIVYNFSIIENYWKKVENLNTVLIGGLLTTTATIFILLWKK